ncbi:PREDICTED: la-related protein 6A isoform X2 [Nelumbo nucifera]|uniref:La-related protein 6A isoform X2 n=1 Tax=Nelumbo nucifera TaxID=4432 RepID=A0A1U8A8D7_NELNU|nr:PREDICTED: la-related protein 6A isoform X2 [Nelumbo nucifera]
MESQGISSVDCHYLPDEEALPVGSPDNLGFQGEDLLDTAEAADPSPLPEAVVLTDDLRNKIIRQVEYYFSDGNLPTDKFLMSHVKKDKEGFDDDTAIIGCTIMVPIAVIASFRKMKKLVRDNSLIVAALKESTQLVVSSDGKKVKRIHPLPVTEVKDAEQCTVLVENLPKSYTTENIQRIFGGAGNIKNIYIRDPHAMEGPKKVSMAEKLISGKIYALVEYETVEAAEKAVATLNDENNWRSGMRVKLLKRMGKFGLSKKNVKAAVSEKNNNVPASEAAGDENPKTGHLEETHEPEYAGGHSPTEKTGRRGRNRGRFRGHKHHSTNGLGHGTLHSGAGIKCSNPPRVPRMPDGTRGFTMGRGRPPVSTQN